MVAARQITPATDTPVQAQSNLTIATAAVMAGQMEPVGKDGEALRGTQTAKVLSALELRAEFLKAGSESETAVGKPAVVQMQRFFDLYDSAPEKDVKAAIKPGDSGFPTGSWQYQILSHANTIYKASQIAGAREILTAETVIVHDRKGNVLKSGSWPARVKAARELIDADKQRQAQRVLTDAASNTATETLGANAEPEALKAAVDAEMAALAKQIADAEKADAEYKASPEGRAYSFCKSALSDEDRGAEWLDEFMAECPKQIAKIHAENRQKAIDKARAGLKVK